MTKTLPDICPELLPLALQDAPALIEAVFPAQKVSFEAQRERKAGAGQTLTALGSYWKGRKPLILVRAIVLGSLLPLTQDVEKDLEIFEKLMAFDDESLARRVLAQNSLKPRDIAARIELDNPWDYIKAKLLLADLSEDDIHAWTFPLDIVEQGISISWRRDIAESDRLELIRKTLATFATYEEKAGLGKRPEEVDQAWLSEPIWPAVNSHYAHLGIQAHSHQELVEQLGILRYGHRPRVGDTFCGGGSIPFEAARLGCDVYASDLNPIACMLTWGALNIIGAPPERRAEIAQAQAEVARAVDEEITALGIEHDKHGNRAKAYLYCLETRCPETDWMVPMSPSWVISKTRNVVAKLTPNHAGKRFDIDVVTGVSSAEMRIAEQGTVQKGVLVYELDGRTYRRPIKTLRGDYRDADGNTRNCLRRWEKQDFKLRADDVFQERLYAIQWITKETQRTARPDTFFTSAREDDVAREKQVEEIVRTNLALWQEEGFIPDMEIEPGDETSRLGRERGWSFWHHLFTPRQLLMIATFLGSTRSVQPSLLSTILAFSPDGVQRSAKLCIWDTYPGPGRLPKIAQVFTDQALNTTINQLGREGVDVPFSRLCRCRGHP